MKEHIAKEKLPMVKMVDPIDFLQEEFIRRRKKNAAYSIRAFSKQLGISPARLSQMLNSKRPLTKGQMEKIITVFPNESFARESALVHGNSLVRKSLRENQVKGSYEDLRLEHLRFIADWYHSAIICLLYTAKPSESVTPTWIAKRLGISTVEARSSIQRLIRLGMVERREDTLVPCHKNVATPSDIPSEALRQVNGQMIERAKMALEQQPVHERDITSITMAIDRSKIPKAKEMIRDFRRQLCRFLEEGTPNSVCALNIQLFQLSK